MEYEKYNKYTYPKKGFRNWNNSKDYIFERLKEMAKEARLRKTEDHELERVKQFLF